MLPFCDENSRFFILLILFSSRGLPGCPRKPILRFLIHDYMSGTDVVLLTYIYAVAFSGF